VKSNRIRYFLLNFCFTLVLETVDVKSTLRDVKVMHQGSIPGPVYSMYRGFLSHGIRGRAIM